MKLAIHVLKSKSSLTGNVRTVSHSNSLPLISSLLEERIYEAMTTAYTPYT